LGKRAAKSIRGKFSLRFCSPDKEGEYVCELYLLAVEDLVHTACSAFSVESGLVFR